MVGGAGRAESEPGDCEKPKEVIGFGTAVTTAPGRWRFGVRQTNKRLPRGYRPDGELPTNRERSPKNGLSAAHVRLCESVRACVVRASTAVSLLVCRAVNRLTCHELISSDQLIYDVVIAKS